MISKPFKELLIKIDGMHCEGCEKRIQNALKNLKEIKKVIANYKKGTVNIILKKEISEVKIKEIIEDIGFFVKED